MRGGMVFGCAMVCLCLMLSSCSGSKAAPDVDPKSKLFAGSWQGNGIDSEGNEFAFTAKVNGLGDSQYRMLVFVAESGTEEPSHVLDGVMKQGQYIYTADEGLYVGGGQLDGETFKGFYKGPIEGNFTMQRVGD